MEFEERRSDQLKVRLTAAEKTRLDHTAATLGLTTAEFLRRRGLDYRMPAGAAEQKATANLATALIRLGNNVNQIAKHLNAGRGLPPVEVWNDLAARVNSELDRLYGAEPHSGGPVL